MKRLRNPPDQITIVEFEIPDYLLPSWNVFYSGSHWSKRKQVADEAHGFVAAYLPRGIKPTKDRVDVFVTQYISGKDKRVRRDADNVMDKLVIDGLIGLVIEDDDQVRWAATRARVGGGKDKVVVEVVKAI